MLLVSVFLSVLEYAEIIVANNLQKILTDEKSFSRVDSEFLCHTTNGTRPDIPPSVIFLK